MLYYQVKGIKEGEAEIGALYPITHQDILINISPLLLLGRIHLTH